MSIQQRASKSWAKTSRTASLPPWTNFLGAILLVILVVGLVSRSSSHATPVATIPDNVPVTTPTSAPPTTLPSIPTTPVLTSSGTIRRVPTPAFKVAESAARAIFTGNLNNLPLTPSAVYTAPSTYYPSPSLSRARFVTATASSLSFSFAITPQAGLSAVQQTITVTNVNGPWQWTGEAG